MLGKLTFVPERIDKNLRTRQTSYGEQKYFLVWPEDSEQVLSFPEKYWPTKFNIGDQVTVEIEVAKYNASNTWVNICNFKDALDQMVIETTSGAAANGKIEAAVVELEYIGAPKEDQYGRLGNLRAIKAKTNIAGVTRVEIEEAATYLPSGIFSYEFFLDATGNAQTDVDWGIQSYLTGNSLSRDLLMYSSLVVNGEKTGDLFVVKEILGYTPILTRVEIEIPVYELTFIGPTADSPVHAGAVFSYQESVADTTFNYTGFIPESEFPFSCSQITNSIKKMYPEEFSHPITITMDCIRADRVGKDKETGNWKTTATMTAIGGISTVGLDVPTIADGLKRVNEEFYVNEKYAKAAAALRSIKGMVTYNRAAKEFADLGLSFTEDEYYREIEGRLIAEHKDYDREYFEMLKEQIDDRDDTEWGGDTETGEFLAIFPEEKLVVVEMPVPNRATYVYRIRDGMPINDVLSRINLASPANGIRRQNLISGNTFKQAIVDSRPAAAQPAAQKYLDDLVTAGLIDDEDDNLKAWTGFIGRIMHRSYENYEEKLSWYLENAEDMILTSKGYEMPKTNPIGTTLISAMVSGAVAAIVGDYVGRQQVSDDIDDALHEVNTASLYEMNELFEDGHMLVAVGEKGSMQREVKDAEEKGYSDIKAIVADNGVVFVLGRTGESRSNPAAVSEETIEAYETFHDQPHRNVIKARAHEKKSDTQVLGPLKHVIYFCSKWSEDEDGNIVDENNVDVHYIHEWNEDGDDNDPGPNCMYVAADKDMKNIIILGNCEVLDVGITDAESPNASASKLLSSYKTPTEMSWIGECKEIAYIDDSGKKQTVKLKNMQLCTDSNLKKLYLVED